MVDEKIINTILDYARYNNINVFDALLEVAEEQNLDVEDIVKSLDVNILCELKQHCVKERKVLNTGSQQKYDIESLFS